jgi:hypothetical protein
VADWDNTESKERDEDAAWRDLVARFGAPADTEQPVPWPAREDVPPAQPPQEPPGSDGARGAETARGTPGVDGGRRATGDDEAGRAEGELGGKETDGEPGAGGELGTGGDRGVNGTGGELGNLGGRGVRGFDDEGIRSALHPDGFTGALEPDVIQAAPRRRRPPPAHSVRSRQVPAGTPDDEDEERFVPPAPPPLPKLDSVTKGAWAALFGGPGYLVVATAAGWSVSGIAAFCAVAAFVTGFALLVLRMNEPGSGGPDDGDDGAVV